MRFQVLGSVRVVAGPPVGSGQVARLLGTLLLESGSVVPHRRLLAEVLGSAQTAQGSQDLYVAVSRLRRLLRSSGAVAELVREPGGYRLEIEPDDLDANRFEALVASARRSEGRRQRLELYDRALGLWRGEVLAGLDLPPSGRSRVLTETRESAIEERFRCALALGRYHDELPALLAACRARPARESLWALAMEALAATGRRDEALATFQEIRHHLATQLGIEPSLQLRTLERRMLDDTPAATGWGEETGDLRVVRAARRFIGRVAELATVGRFTRSAGPGDASGTTTTVTHRLLTIVGAGGVGKTALVRQALRSLPPAGATFVDLTVLPGTTPHPGARHDTVGSDACDADGVAAAIGAAMAEDVFTVDELLQRLGGRETVVVLDNAEHLPAVAEVVTELLRGCAGVRVVVTSRQPLGLEDEPLLRLAPLSGPEAEELLRHLAERTDILGPLPAQAVSRLGRMLDGIPLAIELAASRLRTMSLTELVELLDGHLTALRRPDGDGRHASLVSVVTWSTDLLPATAQALFRRLAVFAGGFDLPALLAVCPSSDDPWQTIDDLDRLVRASLVVAEDRRERARYRLLEPVRAVAAEQLGAAMEAEGLRNRHAAHYASFLACSPPGTADDTIRLELANLRSAAAHTIATGDAASALTIVAGLAGLANRQVAALEVEDWAAAALALPGAHLDPNARWAHHVIATIRNLNGDTDRCEAHACAARQIELDLALPPEPRITTLMALCHLTSGRHGAARAEATRALARARELGRPADEVDALLYLVAADRYEGVVVDRALLEAVDDAAGRAGLATVTVIAQYLHGIAAFGIDDVAAAAAFERCAATAATSGVKHMLLFAVQVLHTLALADGDLRVARRGLAVAVDRHAAHNRTFAIRRLARDYLPAFAQAGDARAVAMIDGAAFPTAFAAAAAARAVAAARAELGVEAFEEAGRLGRALDNEGLLRLLLG